MHNDTQCNDTYIMTLNIMTFIVMTLGIMTLSIMTFGIKKICTITLSMAQSIITLSIHKKHIEF
jgi:hypothetical protein